MQEERAEQAAAKWLSIMKTKDERERACRIIQAAFRKFSQRCKAQDSWPSDNNPQHFKYVATKIDDGSSCLHGMQAAAKEVACVYVCVCVHVCKCVRVHVRMHMPAS